MAIITKPYQSPHPPAWVAFGARLRSERMQLGCTLRRFADLIGYSAVAISMVEQGNLNPALESVAFSMCVELGIDVREYEAAINGDGQ